MRVWRSIQDKLDKAKGLSKRLNFKLLRVFYVIVDVSNALQNSNIIKRPLLLSNHKFRWFVLVCLVILCSCVMTPNEKRTNCPKAVNFQFQVYIYIYIYYPISPPIYIYISKVIRLNAADIPNSSLSHADRLIQWFLVMYFADKNTVHILKIRYERKSRGMNLSLHNKV